MHIEVVDGDAGWPLVETLDREVYPPEVMATVIWRDVSWAHADKRVLVRVDDRVVCHVGLYLRDGQVDGAPARIGGIGGVMTSACVRRKGIASAAMQSVARLMQDDGIDFGLLFCEPHNMPLYVRLGWRKFAGEVFCDQPSGRMRFDMMGTMILPLRTAPQRDTIDLCGLPW
jgi:aminoglycoside 2'-N-acetyltransferase I